MPSWARMAAVRGFFMNDSLNAVPRRKYLPLGELACVGIIPVVPRAGDCSVAGLEPVVELLLRGIVIGAASWLPDGVASLLGADGGKSDVLVDGCDPGEIAGRRIGSLAAKQPMSKALTLKVHSRPKAALILRFG